MPIGYENANYHLIFAIFFNDQPNFISVVTKKTIMQGAEFFLGLINFWGKHLLLDAKNWEAG